MKMITSLHEQIDSVVLPDQPMQLVLRYHQFFRKRGSPLLLGDGARKELWRLLTWKQ
jgi:hypothetical protein